jgi:hypothetical protein
VQRLSSHCSCPSSPPCTHRDPPHVVTESRHNQRQGQKTRLQCGEPISQPERNSYCRHPPTHRHRGARLVWTLRPPPPPQTPVRNRKPEEAPLIFPFLLSILWWFCFTEKPRMEDPALRHGFGVNMTHAPLEPGSGRCCSTSMADSGETDL